MEVRCQHGVACPGSLEEVGPLLRVERLGLEQRSKGLERNVAVVLPMECLQLGLLGRREWVEAVDVHPVPARVAAETIGLVGIDPGDGRDREHAPVDEDADLVVVEPAGVRSLVE